MFLVCVFVCFMCLSEFCLGTFPVIQSDIFSDVFDDYPRSELGIIIVLGEVRK